MYSLFLINLLTFKLIYAKALVLVNPIVLEIFYQDLYISYKSCLLKDCQRLSAEKLSTVSSPYMVYEIIYYFNFYSSVGWRLGLQQITGLLITTFLLGTFYRSASLYHPQRRAILHLKTQKRKIKNKDKEKNKLQVRLKNYV